MSLNKRLLAAISCLAAGLALQAALLFHLDGAPLPPFPELGKGLNELPLEIAGRNKTKWFVPPQHSAAIRKEYQEKMKSLLPFHADDLLSRLYVEPDRRIALNLYMVYSRTGEDRKHHPEVCIRDVAGAPEISSSRLYLDKERERPVQRFRFQTGSRRITTVYYWHYALIAEAPARQSFLRTLHHQLSRSAPSVTVQVSTTAEPDQLAPLESGFLPAVDAHMRTGILPVAAKVGCNRLNILVVK